LNGLQLDMFSQIYYSTLGFDEDMIDYLTFIEDTEIRKLFPSPVYDGVGRRPWDPIVLFRMHFLYYTRPEFVSYRQMCKELSKPKHQDYRNFLGLTGCEVPSHSALCRFRKQLGIGDEEMGQEKIIDGINRTVVHQAKQMEGFLNLVLGSLDSRPVYANVGGFKKECTCKTPDKCTCPVRFSDKDAKVGRQRTKVNQNRFFVGYRKNTIVVPSAQGPMPIGTVVVDAKVSDGNMLLTCLKYIQTIGIYLLFLIADMGYIEGKDKVTALTKYNIAVNTEVKKNMIRPEVCDDKGRVLCPEGHIAEFVGFDSETLTVTYCGNCEQCSSCIRYGTCEREFVYSFENDPQFFGPVPQGSTLQKRMLRFRKQSELNFALEANLLDGVLHHKKLTIRGLDRVETYLKLADICRLIMGMVHHSRQKHVKKERHELLEQLAQQEIYDCVRARTKKKETKPKEEAVA
jgi:hypothetical protein